MTTHPILNRWLWGTMLAASILVWLVLQCASCGPGLGPAQQAARTAGFVMRALCSDMMTVQECGDVLDEYAKQIDGADGGRD